MTRTITVCSVKGGVGKTVTTFFLATAAARDGLEVLAVDGDPQMSLTEWHADASPVEFDVAQLGGRRHKERVQALGAGYDLVLVDTPPSEADANVVSGALSASDVALVPIGPERVEVSRLVRTMELTMALGVPTAVVLTRTDPRWTDHKSIWEALQADQDLALLGTPIPRLRAISQSFGRALGPDLYGYDLVWRELRDAMNDMEDK